MNKRQIIRKIIDVPKKADRNFWAKEFTLLNRLLDKFPDLSFWEKADIKKVPSVAIFLSTELSNLERKYKEYFFQIENKQEEIKLGNKVGEDYNIANKIKSIKDFLK